MVGHEDGEISQTDRCGVKRHAGVDCDALDGYSSVSSVHFIS